MPHKMRRADRALSPEAAGQVLKTAGYGVLSCVGDDYLPYGVPLSFVYDGSAVFFHCAGQGRKLDNINRTPFVCFTAVSKSKTIPEDSTTAYESAVVEGTAAVVTGEQEKRRVLRLLCEKYSPGIPCDSEIDKTVQKVTIVEIKPLVISGKCNNRF